MCARHYSRSKQQARCDTPRRERYELGELLGEGRGGQVFRALDRASGRVVALKRLRRLPQQKAVSQEFALLARLSHPCLVEVVDFFYDELGRACFTMPLLEGAGQVERLRRLPLPAFTLLARDLLWGLSYLHAQSIVHADLKPANVYLPEGGGRARLLDFGLAVEASNKGASARGTLLYAAPEVLKGCSPGVSSDLYSLGVVLYEALTGAPPFAGHEGEALLAAKLEGVIPSVLDVRPEVPAAIDEAIQQLLQTSPQARCSSATEAAEAFADASGEPSLFELVFAPGVGGQGTLCGRDGLLEDLETHFEWDSPDPHACVVWLEGEAGMGKSRALEEMAIRARLRGFEVMTMSSSDNAPVVLALARLMGRELPSSDQSDAPVAHHLLELTEALIQLAPEGGRVFIALDTAEAMDALTRQWLSSLSTRRGVCGLHVLAAARPTDAEGDIVKAPAGATEVALSGLDQEGVSALISGALGATASLDGLSAELSTRTGGNPLLIEEHLRHLSAIGALRWRGGRWFPDMDAIRGASVGSGLTSHLKARLNRLEAPPRSLLQAVAVCGERASLQMLGQMLGAEVTQESAVGLGGDLIEVHEGALVFRQRLMRDTIYEGLSPEHRVHLHARALANLSDTEGSDLSARLRHAEGAGELGLAASLASQAAEEAHRTGAFSDEARLLTRALAAVGGAHPVSESLPTKGELLLRRGEALLSADRMLEAVEALRAALGCEGVDVSRGWHRLGGALAGTGDHEGALEAYEAALGAPHLSAEQRAQIDFDRGWSLMLLGRYDEVGALSREARVNAERAGDQHAVAQTAYLQGTACWQRGDSLEASEHLREAVALAEACGARLLLADARHGLGTALRYQGDLKAAAATYQAAEEVFEALGLLKQQAKCINNMGIVAYLRGRWGEAQHQWSAFREIAERLGLVTELVNACNNLGTLYKDRGALELAVKTFEQGLGLARELHYVRLEAMLLGNLGEALLRMGQWEAAEAALDTCRARAEQVGAHGEVLEVERRRAELWLCKGDAERALNSILRTLKRPGLGESPLEHAQLIRVRAAAEVQLDLMEAARLSISEAMASLEAQGSRYELAQALIVEGRIARLGKRPGDALQSLDQAIQLLEPLGARLDLAQAREELDLSREAQRFQGGAQSRLRTVMDLTRRLGTLKDLDEVLLGTVEAALEVTALERGFVILFDDQGRPCIQAAQNIEADQLAAREDRPCYSVAQEVFKSGEPVGSLDLNEDERFGSQMSVLSMGIRSVRCVPIKIQDQTIGVVYADSRAPARTWRIQEEIELLEALAGQAGIFIENARLLREERRKSRLIALTAHEINRPLSSLLLFTQDMLLHSESLDNDDRESLEIIEGQAKRLHRLTRSMLKLARMDSGQVDLSVRRVPVGITLERALNEVSPLALEKDIALTLEVPDAMPSMLVDRDRIIQVVINLLGNAIKFTPPGGCVEVRARIAVPPRTQQAGARWARHIAQWESERDPRFAVHIEVEDSGPGIAEDEATKVFDSFVQVHPDPKTRQQGAGLGLTIVREIIKAHKGRVWTERGAGGGACFCFEVFAAKDPHRKQIKLVNAGALNDPGETSDEADQTSVADADTMVKGERP